MATTLTTFNALPRNFPIIGYHDPQMSSAIPGASIIFNAIGSQINVAASGADQQVKINCPLARGYSYALVEVNLRVSGVDAADWEDLFQCAIDDDNSAPKLTTHMALLNAPGEVHHGSTTLSAKIYQVLNPLQKVIRCDGDGDGRIQLLGFNPVIDGTVMELDFYVSILRFSLNQGFHYGVNTPVPVR